MLWGTWFVDYVEVEEDAPASGLDQVVVRFSCFRQCVGPSCVMLRLQPLKIFCSSPAGRIQSRYFGSNRFSAMYAQPSY